eukprot:6367653-Alexandrium_andersonii.AAC.1
MEEAELAIGLDCSINQSSVHKFLASPPGTPRKAPPAQGTGGAFVGSAIGGLAPPFLSDWGPRCQGPRMAGPP